MKPLTTLPIFSTLFLAAFSVNAGLVVFDDKTDANFVLASGANTGNPDVWGPTLSFSDFTVSGGYAGSNVLTRGGFSLSQITMAMIDQDAAPAHGGLGSCSESTTCAGSSDSLSSNTNASGPGGDEILLFEFDVDTFLQTVWLNGDHNPLVDGDLDGTFRESSDSLYNVFYSTDGTTYSSIFGSAGQQQPTNLDYFNINTDDSYKHWAVAASGWGDHGGYVEAIEYTSVPEPSIFALLGAGLAGLGFARRRKMKP